MRRWQVPEIHPLSVRPLIRRAVWRMRAALAARKEAR